MSLVVVTSKELGFFHPLLRPDPGPGRTVFHPGSIICRSLPRTKEVPRKKPPAVQDPIPLLYRVH